MASKIIFDNVGYARETSCKEKNVFLFRNVSFSVEQGEIFTITGHSGSGKTTLLRLINRLEDPCEGRLFFNGKPLVNWEVRDLRRKVVLVSQRPINLGITVFDNISYGPRLVSKEADLYEPALSCLLKAGLNEDFIYREFNKLSVGEQQRVAFARALSLNAEVLLLDEPTSSLDETSKAHIENTISELNRDNMLTIIMVTHDLCQASRLSTKGMILNQGCYQIKA